MNKSLKNYGKALIVAAFFLCVPSMNLWGMARMEEGFIEEAGMLGKLEGRIDGTLNKVAGAIGGGAGISHEHFNVGETPRINAENPGNLATTQETAGFRSGENMDTVPRDVPAAPTTRFEEPAPTAGGARGEETPQLSHEPAEPAASMPPAQSAEEAAAAARRAPPAEKPVTEAPPAEKEIPGAGKDNPKMSKEETVDEEALKSQKAELQGKKDEQVARLEPLKAQKKALEEEAESIKNMKTKDFKDENGEEFTEKELKAAKDEKLAENKKKLDAVKEKMKPLEDEIAAFDKEIEKIDSVVGWKAKLKKTFSLKNIGKGLLGKGKWLLEQMAMGFAFMLPGDIIQEIQAAATAKALYDNITQEQSFGGIKMHTISGLIPKGNAALGVFLYVDSVGGDDLQAPDRRFFVSYPGSYGDLGKDYCGPSVSSMVELTTGAVIDSAGVITQVIPLFASTGPAPQNAPNPANMQLFIDAEYRRVDGEIHTIETNSNLLAPNFGATKGANVAPSGNHDMTVLFKPDVATKQSPVFKRSLNAFAAGLPTLANFPGLQMQEMHGIGAFAYVLSNYDDIFTSGGAQASVGPLLIAAAQKGTDLTSDTTIHDLTSQTVISKSGAHPTTSLVSQGNYIYQSATTPIAQFMRSKTNQAFQKYVFDYLVVVDDSNTMIPLQVPIVVPGGNPVVVWGENPAIAYVVSLLTGATYAPGALGTMLLNPDGSPDYTIGNAVNATFVTQFKPVEGVLNQVAAMRKYSQELLGKGPFPLSRGLFAQEVDFSEFAVDQSNLVQQKIAKVQAIDALGNALSGIAAPAATGVSEATKETDLKIGSGIYIYKIENALAGSNGVLLPDYVIAVCQGASGFNIVSLGVQAAQNSGLMQPQVSSTVTAIISLVTGQIYDRNYSLMPAAFTAQQSGVACPLATAFMETDLNPANNPANNGNASSSSKVAVAPFYFLTQTYSYCPAPFSPLSGAQDAATYLAAPFMSITPCTTPQTTPVSLGELLPSNVTGIQWPADAKSDAALQLQLQALGVVTPKIKTLSSMPTLMDVHAAWKQNLMNESGATAWTKVLALAHQQFTAGVARSAWTVTADPRGLSNAQSYLYSVTKPGGQLASPDLWVTATLPSGAYNPAPTQIGQNQSGAVYGIAATKNITVSDFTGVAAEFLAGASSANALINIFDGSVLVKGTITDGSGNSLETMLPLVNLFGTSYHISTVNLVPNISKLSPAFQATLASSQSAALQDRTGPFFFRSFTMFIGRDQMNNGNYIYQAYNGDINSVQATDTPPTIYDYLVTISKNQKGTVYGGPLNNGTDKMLSLVTGTVYSRTGSSVIYKNVLPGTSKGVSLTEIPGDLATMMKTNSGISVDSDLMSIITAANKAYATQLAATKTAISADAAALSYTSAVLANLLLNAGITQPVSSSTTPATSTIAFKFPSESNLTAYSDNEGLWQDTSGNFYLQSIVSYSTAFNKYISNYYVFNIAKPTDFLTNPATGIKSVLTIPTGAYFQPNLTADPAGIASFTPINVISGQSAQSMADKYGITINSDDGTQTKILPIARRALPMLAVDKNLAGGKDGAAQGGVMQLVKNIPLVATGSSYSYFLYQNMSNTSSQMTDGVSQSTVTSVDTLVQVNHGTDAPYYVSLLNGLQYSIDGQPMTEFTKVFYPQDTSGNLIAFSPLTLWGTGTDISLLVPEGTQTPMTADSMSFQEFTLNQYGTTYQYVSSDGSKIFNYAYTMTGGNADGGVCQYQIDSVTGAQTLNATPAWPAVQGQPVDSQAATNMNAALYAAAAAGQKLSQKIYSMTSTDGTATAMTAQYAVITKQWLLLDSNSKSMGQYFPAEDPVSGQQLVTAQVLSFLGDVTDKSGTVQAKNADDASKQRLVYFTQSPTKTNNLSGGKVTGFIFKSSYYGLVPTKPDNYQCINDTQILSQGISPTLSSAVPTTQDGKTVYYTVLTDSTGNKSVYSFVYPEANPAKLRLWYDLLQVYPCFSNKTEMTLVPYLNVAQLTPVTTGSVQPQMPVLDKSGNPVLDSNKKPEMKIFSFADYQTSALTAITTKYATLTNNAKNNTDNTKKGIGANMALQVKTAANTGASSSGSAILSNVPAPKIKSADASAQRSANMLNDTLTANTKKWADQQKSETDALNVKFTAISSNIGILSTTPNGNVYCNIATIANLPALYTNQLGFLGNGITTGYISYPDHSDPKNINPGGFIFDVNGVPTGAVASVSDMNILQNTVLGGLRISSKSPVTLSIGGV